MKPLTCGLLLISAGLAQHSLAQSISYLTQLCPTPLPNSSAEVAEQSWTCPEQQRPLLQEKFKQLVTVTSAGLSITSQTRQPFQFQHNQVDGEQFRYYGFDGCTEDERYCIVFAGGWEWWQHLLLDRKTGKSYAFTGTLYLSPDQQHLLELQDSRLSDTFDRNIIKLYKLGDGPPELQLDLSDSDFGGHQPLWSANNKLTLQLWYYSETELMKLEYRDNLQLSPLPDGWKLRHTQPEHKSTAG